MMRSSLLYIGALGVAIALLTAGCGNSATGSSAQTACQVLTIDMTPSVIGTGARVSYQGQPSPHESQCQYMGSGGAVTLYLGDWTVIQAQDTDTHRQPVPGIGDEASVSPQGLMVRKGTRGIILKVQRLLDSYQTDTSQDLQDQESDAAEQLAPTVLAKI